MRVVVGWTLLFLSLIVLTCVWDWLALRECLDAGNSWLFCVRVLG
jgi:hypothetical protein